MKNQIGLLFPGLCSFRWNRLASTVITMSNVVCLRRSPHKPSQVSSAQGKFHRGVDSWVSILCFYLNGRNYDYLSALLTRKRWSFLKQIVSVSALMTSGLARWDGLLPCLKISFSSLIYDRRKPPTLASHPLTSTLWTYT